MRILMVAAENDAITGMKVGGVADVVRDVPKALCKQGHAVDVLVPAYDLPGLLDSAKHLTSLQVPFAGHLETVELYEWLPLTPQPGVRQFLLQHPLFTVAGAGKIYCDDPADRPFSTDATKFALFSAGVAQCLVAAHIASPDVLHLHDWHTALVAVLIAFNPDYQSLQSLHAVFTIHNLALQGTRPLRHDESAFETWFPHIAYDGELICDPAARHCINPMRAGLNLVDRVHVVSPRYAEEILLASDHELGFFGGEGWSMICSARSSRGVW
ncbi:glycogen/starch synthase [Oceanicoccus sp. KOV_DT_Chl]|uniref:glycogen/starch synthase n=1 Tax=Oceanicoccus sp. KOV_DT_Chl TaxID=1904639 RepID=UPI00190E9D51|nr:glycogen/starch synthase [Oceanicoccus sp. KOV_DT_Chl]